MSDAFERSVAALKVERHKYHAAIGHFVLTYAEAELVLYKVLLHYSKMSDEVGRSVFSGQRAKTITSSIDKIAINTKVPKERHADLKFLFAQMTAINTMRDYVVHNGNTTFMTMDFGQEPSAFQYIDNEARAPVAGKAWIYQIDFSMIDNMRHDLQRINVALQKHLESDPHSTPFSPIEKGDIATWLYKSPQ